ncbi:hypothetical protein PAEPH01_2963 [Pancytospora epiphaga]|nr:hypothetical protein PAEPH01_2963 [Pancytospora epiphaga]
MARAVFEIECLHPEIVRDAVLPDDTHPIRFTVNDNILTVEIEASSVKELMKISYSMCNRIQLSIDTIERFVPKD